jgi:cell division protein ZapA
MEEYMGESKAKINVRINGNDYTLVHQETDDYIQRVVLYLNNKIAEAAKGGLKLKESMELVLASLNITDELFKSQKNYMTLKNELNRMMDEYEDLKQNNKVLSDQIEQLLAKIDQLDKEIVKKDVQLSGINGINK